MDHPREQEQEKHMEAAENRLYSGNQVAQFALFS